VRATDEADFIQYAESARGRLRQVAYLLCGDWDRAEDATQDALARLYSRWPRIDRTVGLRTYAHRTVVSAVIDGAKRPWRRERVTPQPVDETAPDRRRNAPVEDRLVIAEALATLPDRQRACVVLRYFEDLTVRETAKTLRVAEGTVKSQTARGLESLRRALSARGYERAMDNSEGITS
jgi:RNA polymerase sigma-70 factor (sigma-E family)